MLMPADNRKELKKRIEECNEKMAKALRELTESLKTYGFSGQTGLQLTVSVDDDFEGKGFVEVKRETTLKFQARKN